MDDNAGRNRAAALEVDWSKLDKNKFYAYATGLFSGVTVVLYPISVVKTRLQVASHDAVERNAFSVIKGLMKREGIPGFYKGFGTVITGTIPARIIFSFALEKTKVVAYKMVEPLSLSDLTKAAIANGVGGMMGSTCSQVIFVPIDVISQRLMVQGYSGHSTTYSGGLDVARRIIKAHGVRGLYRGLGLSIATYSPSSGVWWASYGVILLAQASGGIFAAATATLLSNPLDTMKTRLQMTGHAYDKGPTAKQVVRSLIADGGWTGFYRGLGPRFFTMSAWGTSMIVRTYSLALKLTENAMTFCIVLLDIFFLNHYLGVHFPKYSYVYYKSSHAFHLQFCFSFSGNSLIATATPSLPDISF
ncbi:hypothetical protein ACS0TY_028512 [Phlomoides rotata]